MPMTDADVQELLSGAHIAVLATVDERGRPYQAPIWYHWRDGEALMLTARDSKKWRNILANPHASLCVDTKRPPYQAVVLHGEVSEADGVEYKALLREMAIHYLGDQAGNQYADDSTTGHPDSSVVFRLKPSRIAKPMG